MDAALRELARAWEQTRTPVDADRYLAALARTGPTPTALLRARVEVGDVHADRVRLAAWLGDERAREVLGSDAPHLPCGLRECLAGLLGWGDEPALRGVVGAGEDLLTDQGGADDRALLGLLSACLAALDGDPVARGVLCEVDTPLIPPPAQAAPLRHVISAVARAVAVFLRGGDAVRLDERLAHALLVVCDQPAADGHDWLGGPRRRVVGWALEGAARAQPLAANVPLACLGLPPRVERALVRAGHSGARELLGLGRQRLQALPGIGPRGAQQIEAALATAGELLTSPLSPARLGAHLERRVRQGALDEVRVQVAATCGDPGARWLLDPPTPAPGDLEGLLRALVREAPLAALVQGLLELCRLLEATSEQELEAVQRVRRARAWLEQASPEALVRPLAVSDLPPAVTGLLAAATTLAPGRDGELRQRVARAVIRWALT